VQFKKPEIREAILASAFELFSSVGYATTTVPRIAERAGVSSTNLYRYFESKLAILYAIYASIGHGLARRAFARHAVVGLAETLRQTPQRSSFPSCARPWLEEGRGASLNP